MKDVYGVFDDGFNRLASLREVGFKGCFHLAVDLTRVAAYSDFKQGLLVAEVLEGIFSQIGPLFDRYDIPEDEGKKIIDIIIQDLSSLSSVYRSDSSAAYEILADLRLAATKFQFKCYTTWKTLPRQRRANDEGVA